MESPSVAMFRRYYKKKSFRFFSVAKIGFVTLNVCIIMLLVSSIKTNKIKFSRSQCNLFYDFIYLLSYLFIISYRYNGILFRNKCKSFLHN